MSGTELLEWKLVMGEAEIAADRGANGTDALAAKFEETFGPRRS